MSKVVSVRIDSEKYEKLKQIAIEYNTSVNEILKIIIDELINESDENG